MGLGELGVGMEICSHFLVRRGMHAEIILCFLHRKEILSCNDIVFWNLSSISRLHALVKVKSAGALCSSPTLDFLGDWGK